MQTTPRPLSDSTLDGRLWAERVRALFGRGVVPYLTHLFNGPLLVAVLLPQTGFAPVAGWLTALCGVVALRTALWRLFTLRQPTEPAQLTIWWRLFLWGGSLNGLVWGAAAIVLYPPQGEAGQALLLLMIAGMTAGATASAAGIPAVFRAFAVPALTPLCLRLALTWDQWHLAVAAMVAFYGLVMDSIVRRSSRGLEEAGRLRLTNADLVQDLSRTKEQLLHLNRELERRVVDRTAELEATVARQRRSEADLLRYRALVDQSGAGILVVDEASLMLVDANDTAAAMLAHTPEELRRSSLPDIDVAGTFDGERLCRAFLSGLVAEEPRVLEDVRVNSDGIARAMEISASRRELDGRSLVLLVLRDISARKAFEARLAQAGLLASLGGLAAGVAHEVNNPLAYILSNLGFLRSTLQEAEHLSSQDRAELVAVAEESLEGAERVRKIVGDLGTLARQVPDTLDLVDIRSVLESCLSIVSNTVGQRARLVRQLGDVPLVKANRARLSQVFLNVLANAAQAIPEGAPDAHEVRVATRWTGGETPVVIEISDTGHGIPAEERERVFQPFFTTKGAGGVGLGLAVCHSLITGMGGAIRFESAEGRGTRFFISLPPVERAFAHPPRPAPQAVT